MSITYIKGNLFDHIQNNDVIIHVCNDVDRMGSGFVVPLYTKWPQVKQHYHKWFNGESRESRIEIMRSGSPELGQAQVICTLERNRYPLIQVVNMIAQHGTVSETNPRPLDYEALYQCLEKVANYFDPSKRRIIGPKFGAGLAGGEWSIIEAMVKHVLRKFNVTIFEL